MVIDSSALIAILLREPEAGAFLTAIALSDEVFLSAPTLLEASMVMRGRNGEGGEALLDKLIRRLKIKVVPFTEDQAELAREAFALYGRGNHPAKLNFGDCISYAVAKDMGEPLLYKGEDFDKTDCEKVDWQSCVHKDS